MSTVSDKLLNILQGSDRVLAEQGLLKARDKVTVKCKSCNKLVTIKLGDIYRFSTGEVLDLPRCSDCKRKYLSLVNRKSLPSWFRSLLVDSKDIDKFDNGYIKSTDVVTLNCPIHGNYKRIVSGIVRRSTGERIGGYCSSCARIKQHRSSRPKYPQWFIDELAPEYRDRAINGTLTSKDEVEFICPVHGRYKQLVNTHIVIATGDRDSGCPKCVQGTFRSSIEKEIEKSIKSYYNGEVLLNQRGVLKDSRLELDFYLPELKLAIEVNGSYYHQVGGCIIRGKVHYKDKDYHYRKHKLCEDLGIRLISIFDVDWWIKKDKILKFIKDAIICEHRVYGRKTVIKEIDSKLAKSFCDTYHINNGSTSFYSLGMYHNDDLIGVATFTRGRFGADNYELKRLCYKNGYRVIGGLNKFIKYFGRTHKGLLISYSDNDYFNGDSYKKLFKFKREISLDYYWINFNTRDVKQRYQVQSKKLKDKYHSLYEEAVKRASNKEHYIMNKLGYHMVYRCGSKRWELFL